MSARATEYTTNSMSSANNPSPSGNDSIEPRQTGDGRRQDPRNLRRYNPHDTRGVVDDDTQERMDLFLFDENVLPFHHHLPAVHASYHSHNTILRHEHFAPRAREPVEVPRRHGAESRRRQQQLTQIIEDILAENRGHPHRPRNHPSNPTPPASGQASVSSISFHNPPRTHSSAGTVPTRYGGQDQVHTNTVNQARGNSTLAGNTHRRNMPTIQGEDSDEGRDENNGGGQTGDDSMSEN